MATGEHMKELNEPVDKRKDGIMTVGEEFMTMCEDADIIKVRMSINGE